jgi:rhodanese-related sulfurtransferase
MELKKAKEVCPTTTQGLVKQGALLVDVREWDEVNETAFDVPDIMVIPMSELENRWSEIPLERDVVFVCAAGIRSLKATYYLMNRGYEKVMNMQYGMQRWLQKDFPVKGKKVFSEVQSSSCCTPKVVETSSACCTPKVDESSSACCEPTSANVGSCC